MPKPPYLPEATHDITLVFMLTYSLRVVVQRFASWTVAHLYRGSRAFPTPAYPPSRFHSSLICATPSCRSFHPIATPKFHPPFHCERGSAAAAPSRTTIFARGHYELYDLSFPQTVVRAHECPCFRTSISSLKRPIRTWSPSIFGFNALSILSRVVNRPNPIIQLGPVDLSCSSLWNETMRLLHCMRFSHVLPSNRV